MQSHHRPAGASGRRFAAIAALGLAAALVLAACGSSGSGSSGSSSSKKISVALVLKDFNNPYFVTMKQDAQSEAAKQGVDLKVSAGKSDGDTTTQVAAVENAISAGAKGILITPNGPAVTPAIQKAKATASR